jgi:hypothetical protein
MPDDLSATDMVLMTLFVAIQLFKALQDVLQFTQPLLLRELMLWVTSYTTDSPDPAYRGILIAGKYGRGKRHAASQIR